MKNNSISQITFVCYTEWADDTSGLSNEQFGELMRSVMEYAKTGFVPYFSDPVLQMAFKFIMTDIDKDKARYEAIKQKRSEAGRKGRMAQVKDDNMPF